MAALPIKYQINAQDYYRIGRTQLFSEAARMELIEGEIVRMVPIGSGHAGHVNWLLRLFTQLSEEKTILSVQGPIRLDDYSEPVPDLVLLKPRLDYYKKSHPKPEDVYLIVEVSDTTIYFDRNVKRRLYARHNIPEFWIVDLHQKAIEIFRKPGPGGYQESYIPTSEETFSPLSFPELVLTPNDIFG